MLVDTWWPALDDATALCPLGARQLQVLLNNGNPPSARFAPEWRRLS
jgi:hypothetical protein